MVFMCSSLSAAVIPDKYTAQCKFPFSEEQIKVLTIAYRIGHEHGLENTIQAMVIKESFVWSTIDRVREVSATDTSYGVSHFRPTTAAWLLVKAGMEPDTINIGDVGDWLKSPSGDTLSINLTMMYMNYKMNDQDKSWRRAIGEYNAGSNWNTSGVKYVDGVIKNVKYLENCWESYN
jgi:hypothetical protein